MRVHILEIRVLNSLTFEVISGTTLFFSVLPIFPLPYLRFRCLANGRPDRGRVPRQRVDIDLGPHVPDAGGGVPAGADQDVDGGVEGEGVDGGQVAVVVPDNLVVLQVPAFHLSKRAVNVIIEIDEVQVYRK